MIKNIISRLTMVKSNKKGFYDIDGDKVHYWTDYYFEEYMAISRWGNRIKLN
jgi:hypothetical protein